MISVTLDSGVQATSGKCILVEEAPNFYRVLYSYATEPYAFFPHRSWIVTIDSTDILSTKDDISGSGGYHSEYYWIWDASCNAPKILKYQESARKILDRYAGDSVKLWSYAVFYPESLLLDSYLIYPHDDYRSPTAGKIKIWYKFENGKLVEDSTIFDPHNIPSH